MHYLFEVVKHENIQKTKATYDVLKKNRRSLSTNYNIARTLIKMIWVAESSAVQGCEVDVQIMTCVYKFSKRSQALGSWRESG